MLTEEYRKNLDMMCNMYMEIHFSMIPAALNAYEDENVREYLFSNRFDYLLMLNALKKIDKVCSTNNYIHSIYLYNEHTGFLSSLKGHRSKEKASDSRLYEILTGNFFARNLIMQRRVFFEGDKEPINVFSFIVRNFDPKSGKLKFAFVCNLSESRIRSILVSENRKEQSGFYIIAADNTFVSHPDPRLFNTSADENTVLRQIAQNPAPGGALFVMNEHNENQLAVWSEQNELGWRFVYLVPERQLILSVTQLRNRLFLIALLVLLCALATLTVLTLRIQRAVEFEKKMSDYLLGFNDFSGNTVLRSRKFCVGILRFEEPSATGSLPARKNNKALPEKLFRWFNTSVNRHNKKTVCLHIQNTLYCTLSDKPLSLYNTDFFMLREKAVREFNLDATAVYLIESVHFDDLPGTFAHLAAELRQTYMILHGLSRRVHPVLSVPQKENNAKKKHTQFDSSALDTALKSRNIDKIESEINVLRDFLLEKRDYFIFKITVTEVGLVVARVFESGLDMYLPQGMDGWRTALFQTEQINEFISLLKVLQSSIELSLNFQHDLSCAKIISYIKQYISDHIYEKNLNAALISDALGMSLNYVRELFRRSENKSINEHIGVYRIELAKQYLTDTDKTVSEICNVVGFTNYSYFCTYFKKNEGLSPSEFRIKMRMTR